MGRLKIVMAFLLAAFLTGCVNPATEQKSTELTVAAAANLKECFERVGESFTLETGIPVSFIFGSTGQLAKQIENGAPVDVFAAADLATPQKLARKGVLEESIVAYAQGVLVLITKDGELINIQSLAEENCGQIAIANPETAPYGKASVEVLESQGLWNDVKEKVVYAKDIQEAVTYFKTGNVDAAFTALSLVKNKDFSYELIDENLYNPILQGTGITNASQNRQAAQSFIEFLQSSKGQQLLVDYGYKTP